MLEVDEALEWICLGKLESRVGDGQSSYRYRDHYIVCPLILLIMEL